MKQLPSRILFITRNFPPVIGGMEEYMYQLYSQFKQHHPTYLIALSHLSKYHLIWFIPIAFFRALFMAHYFKCTHLHLGDVSLSFMGPIIKRLTPIRKISVTAHGLDVLFKPKIYQQMVRIFLHRFDHILVNSRATRDICFAYGVDIKKISVAMCGVDVHSFNPPSLKAVASDVFAKEMGCRLENKKIILTVGRLIVRKGVGWFIENVFPSLSEDWFYIIIGSGNERYSIEEKIQSASLNQRILCTGSLSTHSRNRAYAAADVFVMPNISIDGEIEGFGMVAIEAGLYGTPVVASDIEGIKDAVIKGETGYLVPSLDSKAFVSAIEDAGELNREHIKRCVASTYSWKNVYLRYQKALMLTPDKNK